MSTTQRRSFATGVDAAKTDRSGFSNRTPIFSIKDGEQVYEQFFTNPEEWISVSLHNAVPTKARPADYTGNWPEKMSAVCPNSKMKDGAPIREGGCYICENIVPLDEKRYRAKKRTFGLGLRRVEIIGDGSEALHGPAMKGKRVGFGVDMIEVPKRGPDGKVIANEKEMVPHIEVFCMGWQNFWQKIDGAAVAFGGSITNQVFSIRRTGTGLDTDYSPTPIKELKADLRDPEVAAKYGITIDAQGNKEYPPEIDLHEYVMHQASEEYIERFWIPASGPSVTGQRPDGDATPSALQAMRDRLAAAAASPAAVLVGTPVPEEDFDIEEG